MHCIWLNTFIAVLEYAGFMCKYEYKFFLHSIQHTYFGIVALFIPTAFLPMKEKIMLNMDDSLSKHHLTVCVGDCLNICY